MKRILFTIFSVMITTIFYSQEYSVGEKVMAYETKDELWYQATILEVLADGYQYKIHWEGFSDEFDQILDKGNFWRNGQEYLPSDKLQGLETDGKWYNAKVIKRNLNEKKYFIHWGGFDTKYDRWISYDSLRLPTKENYIEEGNFKGTSGQNSYSGSKSSISASIRIVLENKSGNTIKYETDSGGGAKSSGTLSAGGTCSTTCIDGGRLYINGHEYKTITMADKDKVITIR
jgi:hypothetical protein